MNNVSEDLREKQLTENGIWDEVNGSDLSETSTPYERDKKMRKKKCFSFFGTNCLMND